jgi:hypothetical protein
MLLLSTSRRLLSGAAISRRVLDARIPESAESDTAVYHARLVAQLAQMNAEAREGGGEAARLLHERRGRLPVRERVARLLDTGTGLLEIGLLAGQGLHEFPVPAAGLVCGVGRVAGRLAVVVANDPTVKGGTYFPITTRKHLRAQEIAAQNRLPCMYGLGWVVIFLDAVFSPSAYSAIWSTLGAAIFLCRAKVSPTAITLGVFSTIRPTCLLPAFRR